MTYFRTRARHVLAIALAALATLTGCSLPGKPKPGPDVPRPQSILDASTLYRQNCSGCHGADGQRGAATDLANPQYEALIDEATLRNIIANGEPGSLMPAFSTAHGGFLVDAQIASLARGIRARWYQGGTTAEPAAGGHGTPPYLASTPGDAANGPKVYATACARCHGATAQQPGRSGSILDGSFLALVTPQTIRTTILAGRPDLGMPDYRTLDPSHALTDAEVTDVTAWLIAQRPPQAGQPYPNQQADSQTPGEHQPSNIQGYGPATHAH